MKDTQSNYAIAEFLPDPNILLEAIHKALSQYVLETNTRVLFSRLLNDVLRLTESEFGLISRVLTRESGQLYMKVQVISNIAWNAETKAIYEKHKTGGMEFSELDSLYGQVMTTKTAVISNNPNEDERAHGCPLAHPMLDTYLGLPLIIGDKLIGILCLANRKGGYDESVIEYLHPFLSSCASLIRTHDRKKRLKEVEKEVTLLRQAESKKIYIDLGSGYQYCKNTGILSLDDEVVLLTKNESQLLSLLVEEMGSVVKNLELEQVIWKNGVTSESSLRSLVMRLRKKADKLNITTVSKTGYMLNSSPVENS